MEICKLCDEAKELQRSHVIGRSVFRKLLKTSGCNFVYSPLIKEQRIIKTNDQWVTTLLCKDCEGLLNSKYENYSLWALKNKQKGVKHLEKKEKYSIIGIDQYRLALYIVSIYWRAAQSTHPAYRQVSINEKLSEYLKKCILGKIQLDFTLISIKISKLIDRSKQLKNDALTGFLTSLHPRVQNKYAYSYFMIFEGFHFEFFFGALNTFDRAQKGIVRKNKTIIHLPYLDIFSIKELVSNMMETKKIAKM